MLPASTLAGGMCQAFPDVCLTPAPPAPPVPTPYPNIGQCTDVTPPTASMKVKVENMSVIIQDSQASMSSGDEAGSAGGVTSGMIKGPVTFKMGSSKVTAEGKGICTLTAMTAHNGSGSANMPAGAQIAPSQVKVLVAP